MSAGHSDLMSATISDRSRPAFPIDVGRGGGSPGVGCDLSHSPSRRVKRRRFRRLLAQTVAAELEAVGIVNDAVEDGVSEGRLTEYVRVPLFRID